MSAAEDRARAREWLEEQIEQLAKLRNASPRDPSFKLWRQNTVTVLQRIWPGEPFRTDRFRRITFSPAAVKHGGVPAREWFARGCVEANQYLLSLVAEVDIVGAPDADAAREPAAFLGADMDGTMPMVDLPAAGAASAPQAPRYSMEDNVLELGGDAAASREPREPAGPPRIKVELHLPAEPAPDVAGEAEAPAPRTTRPPRARKPAARPKLKSMLGFDEGHDDDRHGSTPPADPLPMPASGAAAAMPSPADAAASTPAVPPAERAAPLDAETVTRATQDFMRNSPVLSLQGRPVQRTSDVTQFMEPDAVAIATLAGELARLGVPEDARPALLEALVELAQQLDAGAPAWAALQQAVTGAMAYPPLARRLVPVLLPWLERAA